MDTLILAPRSCVLDSFIGGMSGKLSRLAFELTACRHEVHSREILIFSLNL